MRRRWFWSVSGVLIAAMAVGGYRAAEAYRFRASLGRARQEVGQGRHDAARTRLVELSARRPGEGEVDYLLGLSEKAVGNADAALAAWARVPAGSPFAPRASFERGVLAMERGEYALAEQLFGAVLREPERPGPRSPHPSRRAVLAPGAQRRGPRDARGRLARRDPRAPSPDHRGPRGPPRAHRAGPLPRAGPEAQGYARVRPNGRRETTASGWAGRTWRPVPGDSPRPNPGSRRASGGGPRTRRSGGPGWSGRWPTTGWIRPGPRSPTSGTVISPRRGSGRFAPGSPPGGG